MVKGKKRFAMFALFISGALCPAKSYSLNETPQRLDAAPSARIAADEPSEPGAFYFLSIMGNEEKTPLNIWNNVERCWVNRLDIVFEGSRITGIHNSDFTDVVSDLDWLIQKLKVYRDEMAFSYGEPIKKYNPNGLTQVYLMNDSHSGYTKIGRSIDPEKRERTLLGDKSTIELIFVSPKCERSVEKELHYIFREKRVRGEWFDLTADDIKKIMAFDFSRNV